MTCLIKRVVLKTRAFVLSFWPHWATHSWHLVNTVWITFLNQLEDKEASRFCRFSLVKNFITKIFSFHLFSLISRFLKYIVVIYVIPVLIIQFTFGQGSLLSFLLSLKSISLIFKNSSISRWGGDTVIQYQPNFCGF